MKNTLYSERSARKRRTQNEFERAKSQVITPYSMWKITGKFNGHFRRLQIIEGNTRGKDNSVFYGIQSDQPVILTSVSFNQH